jgi:DNA-binding transcriptional LysR family regulator
MNKLDDLPALQVFERVVALGSLTAAANDLGLSLAVASKRLARLEKRIGSQLIHRSTRRLAVSDEGRLLYRYAQRVITELDQAEEAMLQKRSELTGQLKITAPNSFGHRHLLDLLAQFRQHYPGLRLQLVLSDKVEDLIAGRIDVAIRYGELPDSGLVARRLLDNERILCASPDYLAKNGSPETLADLAHHQCIIISHQLETEWRFARHHIKVQGAVSCNDGEAAHTMALNGMGIAMKSYWDVAADLQQGRLQQILPDIARAAAPISIVTLKQTPQAPRIEALVEFLVSHTRALKAGEQSN